MNLDVAGVYLFPGIAMVVVILVFFCDGLSFIYDYQISDRGIQFLLFRKIPIGLIEYDEIDQVYFARPWRSYFNAVSLMNRFRYALRPILVMKKRGIVSKAILLTPRDPDRFLASLKAKVKTSK